MQQMCDEKCHCYFDCNHMEFLGLLHSLEVIFFNRISKFSSVNVHKVKKSSFTHTVKGKIPKIHFLGAPRCHGTQLHSLLIGWAGPSHESSNLENVFELRFLWQEMQYISKSTGTPWFSHELCDCLIWDGSIWFSLSALIRPKRC